MSRDEKEQSHERILRCASRLFRERGLEGASVADVMRDAGMTHGGFYKHFDSKDGLVESALDDAFDEFISGLEAVEAERAMTAFRSLYLSREHLTERGMGCPVAALGTEISRGSASIKRAFGAGVRRMIEVMTRARRGPLSSRRTAALREFSMLVGAMVIARASDAELANEILAACRDGDRGAWKDRHPRPDANR